MRDFVKEVKEFNEIAGTHEEFNLRKSALYTGLILEEISELIASLNHPDCNELVFELDRLATAFKDGRADDLFNEVDRVEFLDACVDIAVVSLGAGIAIGADIEGACLEVSGNNLSKFPIVDGERVVLRDENGKVMKPEGYKKVTLEKFIK